MPLQTEVHGALEVRRGDIDRVEEVAGGIFKSAIFLDIAGAGETFANIQFSVRFVEQPTLTTGWNMMRNQKLIPGNFPVCSAGVYVWQYGIKNDNGAYYYDGATMAITTIGPVNLHLTMHLVFEGRAVRPPGGLTPGVIG